jgi:hypothetical protein
MIEFKINRLKEDFYSKLNGEKFKFTLINENLIKMNLFLSFLTIPLTEPEHITRNYTRRRNDELGLILGGTVFFEDEFLGSIEFGDKLENKYNNFVSPFYIFHLLNKEGQAFFVNYYKEDIEKIIREQSSKITDLEEQLRTEKLFLRTITTEYGDLEGMVK